MFRLIAALLCLPLFLTEPALAHDIAVDATLQAFVKPSGNRLHLLVRVPLDTVRAIDVPVNPRGFLDLEKPGPMMPNAATLWISDFIRLYEDGDPLPRNPQVVTTRI